jgi:hypothetical protein
MPKQKTKKIVTPECDLQVPAGEIDVSPLLDMQAGCTGAPYQETEADTDIQKRIQDEIDFLYPRTRFGTEGLLDAVLRELIRARLCR